MNRPFDPDAPSKSRPLTDGASAMSAASHSGPSLPQPAPAAPAALPQPTALAALRNIAPASLWLARSASQPASKPSRPMTPSIPTTEEPKPQPASWTSPPPSRQPQEETLPWLPEEPPWWLTDAPTDSSLTQPRAPSVGTRHSVTARDGQKPAAAQARETEKASDKMPTRLSVLRGLHFSLGVKELSPKKHAEPDGNGDGAPADTSPANPEPTNAAEALVPRPEPEPAEANVEAKGEETVARKESSRWVTAEPEFLPPPVEDADKGKESRWKRGNYDPGVRDDIQILPSKRGQYKR